MWGGLGALNKLISLAPSDTRSATYPQQCNHKGSHFKHKRLAILINYPPVNKSHIEATALISVSVMASKPGQPELANAKYAAILASHNSLFSISAPHAVEVFSYVVASSIQLGSDDVDDPVLHPTNSNNDNIMIIFFILIS